MSKLKSDIIQKNYRDNYFCKNGHNIVWTGTKYISSFETKCDKCGRVNSNNSPIRWSCEQCKLFYCSICLRLIVDKYCPKKHKIKFMKQIYVEHFDNYTCDSCLQKYKNKDGILYDKECNITYCPYCAYESSDIPEVLED